MTQDHPCRSSNMQHDQCPHRCGHQAGEPAGPAKGVMGKVAWGWRWCWHLLLRNRFAIAVASLVWLLYRSGTQPRRLSYPCQQVAAINVGAVVAGLIPAALLARRYKGGQRLPLRVIARRQLMVAAILCVVGLIGIEGYQFAETLIEPAATELAVPPPPAPEPPAALVGIAHEALPTVHRFESGMSPPQSYPPYTAAEISTLVDKAISRAGGLDQIMVDKNSDDRIDVVIKPNLVTDIDIDQVEMTISPHQSMAERGITTDPRVMARVVALVKEAGVRSGKTTTVTIAEGSASGFPWPGGHTGRDITKWAFINCGYTTNPVTGPQYFNLYDSSVELKDLNDSGGIDQYDSAKVTQVTINNDPANVPVSNAVARKQYWVPKLIKDCDVLINVPTLKNHGNADMTAAMKCQGIGIGPSDIYHARGSYAYDHAQQMKLALHYLDVPGLNNWDPGSGGGFYYLSSSPSGDENLTVNCRIVDMNMARPMDFAVVDGLVGITNGPADWPATHPDPYMQLIIAGSDPVAVDTVAALTMSYDPKYVRYLRLGYNRRLGTMNRGQIEVIGDRPALVRQAFPAGVNRSLITPTPPALTGINVVEGASLISGETVTASGMTDNVGVVRAEAAVALLGDNLVANGDFEDTQHPAGYGWTTWRASWGTNEVWDFNNANVPAGGGQKCLRLGGANTQTSFGVYQQVAVTPGKPYRLDCQWKGIRKVDWTSTLNDPANWFEVILIDGPFDINQADCDACGVRNNYMFAYDDNTYPLQGPAGTSFGWLWTHEQYAPPKNQVDWLNRLGRRTATGSTMTVVLKAGSNAPGGIETYFDNVTLREVSDDYGVAAVGTAQASDAVGPPSNPYVASSCNLTLDLSDLPLGQHEAELRVTAYDSDLSEASKYRNVTVQTCAPVSWVCVSPDAISHDKFVADPMPTGDTFEVWNCACGGGDLNYTITPNVSWIHVVPPDGSSPVNPVTTNLHAVSYDPLPPGQHVGTITIAGQNNSQEITVTMNVSTVAPDLDLDGDVDQADFAVLQNCYSPNLVATDDPCRPADLDNSGYVNPSDYTIFAKCMTGADVYPAANCATAP
jgi:uncharacterized protein (DUF362 family)